MNAGARCSNSVNQSGGAPRAGSDRARSWKTIRRRGRWRPVSTACANWKRLRDWSDGEFRPAGIKMENAINAITEVEQAAQITLTPYRAWLMELQAAAAELHNQSRRCKWRWKANPLNRQDIIRKALRRMVDTTNRLVGDQYTTTLARLEGTYESFLAVYTDYSIRRSEKLNRFNQLFRAMFIDRHPAYPLYRHWYDLVDNAPEFPPPPTSEPTPRIDEDAEIPEYVYAGKYSEEQPAGRRFRVPRPVLLVIGGVIIVGVLALAASVLSGQGAPRSGDDHGYAANGQDGHAGGVQTAARRWTTESTEPSGLNSTLACRLHHCH